MADLFDPSPLLSHPRRGGGLGERERAQLVEETCAYRPNECVTLLAQWSAEVSESSERADVVAGILADPRLAGNTQLALVEARSGLYAGGASEAETDGEDPLAAAILTTGRFHHNYHHAAPFRREVLSERWRRCEADPGSRERCRKARKIEETRLGVAGIGTPK